jgi:hypothetical protein
LLERDHSVVACHHDTARDFLPHSRSLFSN